MKDFIKLVENMCTAQRLYFRTRSATALDMAKDLEFQVDTYIREHSRQQTLF